MVERLAEKQQRWRNHSAGPRHTRGARPPPGALRARSPLQAGRLRARCAGLDPSHAAHDCPQHPLRASETVSSRGARGSPARHAAAGARAADQGESAGGVVVGRTVVGRVCHRADPVRVRDSRGRRAGGVAARRPLDHGSNRIPALHRGPQLPPDHQGLSQGWRLVHRRQGQPRPPGGPDSGVGTDDRLRAHGRRLGVERCFLHRQRFLRPGAVHGSYRRAGDRADNAGQSARHSRVGVDLCGTDVSLHRRHFRDACRLVLQARHGAMRRRSMRPRSRSELPARCHEPSSVPLAVPHPAGVRVRFQRADRRRGDQ